MNKKIYKTENGKHKICGEISNQNSLREISEKGQNRAVRILIIFEIINAAM